MIPRDIENSIVQKFFKGKVIIIIGPRQVGKTTLVKEMMKKTKKSFLWLNGDESDVRELISGANSERLKAIIGRNEIIVIDEAQRISNIGITLKLVVDNIPGIQMIVTGSSALELANKIKEERVHLVSALKT